MKKFIIFFIIIFSFSGSAFSALNTSSFSKGKTIESSSLKSALNSIDSDKVNKPGNCNGALGWSGSNWLCNCVIGDISDGKIVKDGESFDFYERASSNTCGTEKRTCNNGVLSGRATHETCQLTNSVDPVCGTSLNSCEVGKFKNETNYKYAQSWSCVEEDQEIQCDGYFDAGVMRSDLYWGCSGSKVTCKNSDGDEMGDWSCNNADHLGKKPATCPTGNTNINTNTNNNNVSDPAPVEPTATPVNGKCGSSVNSCSFGDFKNVTDWNYTEVWKCAGENGGSSATCNGWDHAKNMRSDLYWSIGNWGTCSSSKQTRNVICKNSSGNTLGDWSCSKASHLGSKPAEEKACVINNNSGGGGGNKDINNQNFNLH